MQSQYFRVKHEKNSSITIKLLQGHFATSSVHTNHYLDMSELKYNARIARDVAKELASPYLSNTLVDTIVCVERTAVIGAYLAQELARTGFTALNGDSSNIHVVTPMQNINAKLTFHTSMLEWITNRNVILLIPSVSSGRTIDRAKECVTYYSGQVVGISALFMALPNAMEKEVNALFTSDDISGYRVFNAGNCEMCKAGQGLSALVSSEGYTRI